MAAIEYGVEPRRDQLATLWNHGTPGVEALPLQSPDPTQASDERRGADVNGMSGRIEMRYPSFMK